MISDRKGKEAFAYRTIVKVNVTFIRAGESVPSRLPANYRLVYDIVTRSGIGRHLTSAQVYAKAVRRRPGIGFSTVYRGLLRLRDLGLISEIVVPGAAAATYEPAGPRHAHLRCSACGEIEDVEYAIPAKTIKQLAQRHGFEIDGERIAFEGRCRSCSAG